MVYEMVATSNVMKTEMISCRRAKMKRTRISMLATFTMLCLAATVMAQPPGGGPGGQGRGGPPGGPPPPGAPGRFEQMMQMFPVMVALDADKNGEISTEEMENATKALQALDKNGDGKLTEVEIRPDFAAMGGGPRGPRGGEGGRGGGRGGGAGGAGGGGGQAMIERMLGYDKDEDGKISKSEMPSDCKPCLTALIPTAMNTLTRLNSKPWLRAWVAEAATGVEVVLAAGAAADKVALAVVEAELAVKVAGGRTRRCRSSRWPRRRRLTPNCSNAA